MAGNMIDCPPLFFISSLQCPKSTCHRLFRFYLRLRPIDQKEFFGCTRECGVKPMYIVGVEHFVGHITLIKIDVRPLSALSLMASHRISIFYLNGIEIIILFNLFKSVMLQLDIGVILHYRIKELLVLLESQGRRLRLQSIQYDRMAALSFFRGFFLGILKVPSLML